MTIETIVMVRGTATWRKRSLVRSACHPLKNMHSVQKRKGGAVRRRVLLDENPSVATTEGKKLLTAPATYVKDRMPMRK